MNARSAKSKKVLERIESIQAALVRAREYLESGQHADWNRFRPLFAPKLRDGEPAPPHPDWVRSVFIPRHERDLRSAEKALERLETAPAPRGAANRRHRRSPSTGARQPPGG
jgi:hypothetical protein